MLKMKNLFKLLLMAPIIAFWGCEDKVVRIYDANTAVTVSFEYWRKTEPKLSTQSQLKNPGKIYMYKNALYINERGKGIHVYDNSNPSNPIDKGFVKIHSNYDVAVKGNTLYAGSYTDILLFDVSNPLNPVYLSREENVFDVHYDLVKQGFDEDYPIEGCDLAKEVVLRWEIKTVEKEYEDESSSLWGFPNNDIVMFSMAEASAMAPSGGSGTGGSMASFTITNNTIYVLDRWSLKYASLSDERDLPLFEEIWLSRTAETLFPHGNNLFIGTTSGMLIYDVSNDGVPSYLSAFNHWTGCDPVVVSDNKAYVTLSSGCGVVRNELHVVDITDLSNPELIKSYEFDHPLGLGVDKNTLFLCDDNAGLKVFDVTDSEAIKDNMIKHYNGINAYDVIPWNNLLIMVGDDGIFQYNYSDPENMFQLSQITVQ